MTIKGRLALTLAVIISALFFLAPAIKPDLPQWWGKYKMILGLDLQGGMHLVLGVDQDKAVSAVMERLSAEVRDSLSEEHIRTKRSVISDLSKINLRLMSEKHEKEAEEILRNDFSQFELKNLGNGNFILTLKQEEIDEIKRYAVDQGIETLRNRIDELGVSEPTIQKQGKDRILVQLPGVKDPDRAIDILVTTAQLEFRIVADSKGPGREIVYQKITEKGTNKIIQKNEFILQKRILMTGDRLTDARVRINSQYNTPYVAIEFDSKGARQFERVTGENVGKRLAIVLDNNVYSAPNIKSKISGGSAMIEGSFTMDEAHDLAIILRAGALPAPLEILENRTVGPTLGKDSIEKGFLSMLIGGVIVILFMAVYYRFSGFVADIVLILNVVFIMAALAGLSATLTLPGIAGIVLTIGMAVDANVIIFERVREELRLGKTPMAALDSGFSKALLPIMDANVTTLIAAIVLFEFGTGPVKGFAVTLSIGILASLFTALFVSRLIFDISLSGKKVSKLSI
ncbi:MAG: protein translocase subunit SecD [Deltaproteobacteria bacterium]|nr:protein translocase subunit SecD [Deltaproteobacteria bacterium]